MADLLPSTPDLSDREPPEPRVVGVDSDHADDMLAALSSDTARDVLTALHEDPATASELADRLDLTLQNVQYHLGNLNDADLVEVADTAYSEKGREMKVYAPADQPLVLFSGREEQTLGLKQALTRLLGAIGILAAASLVVQAIYGDLALPFGQPGGADAGTMAAETTTETAAGLPPGLLFFLGGLVVLGLAGGYWYLRRR